MFTRRISTVYLLIAVAVIGVWFGSATEKEVAAANGAYTWGQVPIGGGGYVTGVEIHPNNADLVYFRTDVGGAYRWDKANDSLIQLLQKEIKYGERNLWGIESLALDPNNQNVLYVAAGTKQGNNCACDILKSTNKGNSWTRAELNTDSSDTNNIRMAGNEFGRWSGERLVVDPNNSSIIYFASRYDGLWKSQNGSAPGSWSKINDSDFNYNGTSANKRGLLSFVAFDPTSAQNNKSQKIYVGVYGKGIYRSQNGGTSFSKMNGSPIYPEQGVVANNGTLYVTSGEYNGTGAAVAGSVNKFTDRWVYITPQGGSRPFSGLDVYKGNSNVIVVSERDAGKLGNNRVYRSTTGGSSWSETSKDNVLFNLDETWGTGKNWSTATADVAIDPTDPKKIWLTSWFGIWRTYDITTQPKSYWKPIEAGHEELVTHALISPKSGANLISGIADYSGFRHTDPLNSAPDEQMQATSVKRVQDTVGLDWAEKNSDLIVRVGGRYWNNAPLNGQGQYSDDNGRTWTPFAKSPQNDKATGGNVAISSDGTHIVWLPENGKPYATSRGNTWEFGNNWTASSGINPSNLIHDRWAPKKILASDRIINKRFYLLDYRNGRFYRSDDGGYNWKMGWKFTGSTTIRNNEWEKQIVRARPDVGGDVWVSSERDGLFRSQNGGNNFTKINNVQEVVSFDFGAPKPGTTTPTIFLYGKANGNSAHGIYRSDDLGGTWENIMGDWTISNTPKVLAGDRQEYGRLYIGTGGSGIYYGDLQDGASNNIFEVGSVTKAQADKNTWYPVNLQNSYTDPVVVMGVPSFRGPDPLTMRVRNITSNRFEYQFDEWDYSLDGTHGTETAAYIVMEAGTHTINGQKWHAETFSDVDHKWQELSLPNGVFGSGATLLAQVVANSTGESAVTPRIRNFTGNSFDVRVQEEEKEDDQHTDVKIGTITTWSGGSAMGSYWMKAGTDSEVNDAFSSGKIEFGRTFGDPHIFAQITSYVGSDTAALRYKSLTSTGVQIKVEEETSKDNEVAHGNETVKWLVIGQ